MWILTIVFVVIVGGMVYCDIKLDLESTMETAKYDNYRTVGGTLAVMAGLMFVASLISVIGG